MMLCLNCNVKKYTKYIFYDCPLCTNPMIKVDGPMRKIVEALHKADFKVASATIESYDYRLSIEIWFNAAY